MRVFDTSSIYLTFKSRKINILKNAYVLTLSVYEFGNIFWKEIKILKAISEEEGLLVLKFFQKKIQEMKIVNPDFVDVLKVALNLNISYYDASFVQAAKRFNVPLITEDKKLKRIASDIIEVYSLSEII